MDRAVLLSIVADSLASITAPRYYETERGFQGELYAEMRNRLGDSILPPGAQLEQEYQKTLCAHGLDIRPDIIIHEPFDERRHAARHAGNHAVIELKLAASKRAASKTFESLVAMIDVLHYPLGIFVNINSDVTFTEQIPMTYEDRIVCFAVLLGAQGKPAVAQA